jgi:NAD(P)-dependent dehydrogenase (short-subunit alcohol dehydrogenase family)
MQPLTALVTGGARGLGLVQVEALIEAGAAAVFALDRLPNPDPKFTDLQKQYPSQRLEYKQVDVTQSESLKQPFKEAADFKGRLDGLVAAAGTQYEAPALDYTAEDYRRILDVNVPSLLILCDTRALRSDGS